LSADNGIEDFLRTRFRALALIGAVVVAASGCAASKAFRQGNAAMNAGDLDQAVAYYRSASQASPDNPNYTIALQRAMLAASRAHFDRAREFEQKDQLEAARGEYQLASEYDPSNRQAAAKVAALDQVIRSRIEAARPRPAIEQLRDRVRAAGAEPLLNPTSREPLRMTFRNVNIRDILEALGNATGINIAYDPTVPQISTTVVLDGVTFEQAMQQIMSVNQLSYKVTSERSILVFPDNQAKHAQYDDQVVQTFYISHADVTELTQLLSQIARFPTMGVQPIIQFNKAANTITVRATANVVQIIEKVIEQNDKARAEIVVDVEILEVNRSRAKQYGLNLSEYALGGVLSPEVSPGATTTTGGGTTGTAGQSTPPSGVVSPPPFNLNTISRGVNTTDFYLAVPTALVRFLETDTQTKLIAKPQLRGTEGTKLSLKLGDSIPVIQTSYTPLATGGAGVNPLSSYAYRDVGVNIDMTPRVTVEGDIILDLMVDNSSLGANISVAGVSVPSFGQRTVTTRLRLRDGESNLLAGLLREDERRALTGFPGAIRVPILKQLFSNNDNEIRQTDIVMLLTPHVIRGPEITEADLKPIYIGSQGALGLNGPPPLIANPDQPVEPAAPAPPAPAAPPGGGTAPGGTVVPPPGSSPVPGTIFVPNPPPGAGVQPPAPSAPAASPGPGAPPETAAPRLEEPAAVSTSPGIGTAEVAATPPPTAFRVGAGPYTVPISIANASRVSTVTLTVTYDASLLRVRSVSEGGFMRSGGSSATFTHQASPGRVDITIIRSSEAVGATGTGLLGAVLFDAIAPGTSPISLSGTATGPGGTAMGLRFRSTSVAIQP
jgi:general secretion pathway protein D